MRGYRLRHPSVGPQALPTCTRVATPGNRDPLCAAHKISSVFLGRAVYRKGCVGQQSYQLINRHVGVASASATSEQAASSEPHSCPRGEHWKVHKFGGTCVADAERISTVCKLLLSDEDTKLVVTSAMGAHAASPVKVTDLLLNMVNKASRQDDAFLLDLAQLQQKHVETAKTLLGDGAELNAFISTLFEDITNLKAMLQAISIAGMATEAFTDFVVGHGELWCAQLMAATCRTMGADAEFMDTRDVLVVTPTADGASVDVQYGMSDKRLDLWYAKRSALPKLVIATGFIARNLEGQATTLKRNGSDYSATIMGALFRAGCITIWTDVDGVYSADPRKVPEAVCLTSLTYHEAWELSYFGANVLHPRTTLPAMKYGIPIMIRNFFDQASAGTLISDGTDTESPRPLDGKSSVKGFATIDNVALVNLEGTGMVGVPGVASTIFGAIRDAGVNVIMISQASSEHSVCFAVKQADGAKARQVLERRFQESLQAGRVHSIEVIDDCCVLAAVGSGMASKKGVSATMFSALANGNINVRAIAQGCSEYNITVLIDQKESTRALRAVHGRFYLSDVAIGAAIVGPGLIGGTLLDQVKEQLEYLHNQLHVDVRVLALASSSKMLLSDSGICLDSWKQQFQAEAEPCDLERLGQHLASSYIPNTAIIDCTASDEPATFYAAWMKQGIHVITPNKKLGSGPLAQYKEVQKLRRVTSSHFFYEATVGAGLPIIGTLQHLMETGDKVLSIEGIFSGTLSYIFNTWGTDDRAFSQVVAEAKELGYTEPDPRDDLAGMDVARKVIILAREAGLNVELDDVPVASLVPDELASCETAVEFMERLPEFDGAMSAQLEEAKAAGEVLRFVGVVDCQTGKGSVELRRYPSSHAFAQLKGSDNIISFTTSRYISQPLTIIGPGAGAAVTAGGVFSDFLRLASSLGGSSLF